MLSQSTAKLFPISGYLKQISLIYPYINMVNLRKKPIIADMTLLGFHSSSVRNKNGDQIN